MPVTYNQTPILEEGNTLPIPELTDPLALIDIIIITRHMKI
jgi:hypothetical protein